MVSTMTDDRIPPDGEGPFRAPDFRAPDADTAPVPRGQAGPGTPHQAGWAPPPSSPYGRPADTGAFPAAQPDQPGAPGQPGTQQQGTQQPGTQGQPPQTGQLHQTAPLHQAGQHQAGQHQAGQPQVGQHQAAGQAGWSGPPPSAPTSTRERRGPGWGALIGACLVCSLVGGGVAAGVTGAVLDDNPAPTSVAEPASQAPAPPIGDGTLDWRNVASAVSPSVVSIQVAGQSAAGAV